MASIGRRVKELEARLKGRRLAKDLPRVVMVVWKDGIPYMHIEDATLGLLPGALRLNLIPDGHGSLGKYDEYIDDHNRDYAAEYFAMLNG